jgi:uncharacterized membrane protein YjdF
MIADGATLFTEVGLEVLAGLIAKIDREWLLQMRNLYSVSVFCIQFHTALIKLFFVENHLYKRKFMEVFCCYLVMVKTNFDLNK